MRNSEAKENSQRRPNNNNVVIKYSQGPLVLSRSLYAEPYPVNSLIDTESPNTRRS